MGRVAITSLAILKVNWDEHHKDYIENFVPLVAHAIRLSTAPVISLPEVQGSMLKNFGLRVPLNSLKIILTRLVRKGLLRSEQKSFVPVSTELQNLNVEAVRKRVVAQHEAVISKLQDYVQSTFSVKWDPQEADDALLLYIKEKDLQIITSSAERTPIPAVGRSIRNSRFLVNSFIRSMSETNTQVFGYIETIAKGNMLANALIFPNLSEIQRNFKRTQVFLDTRPILNALGLCGPHYQAPVQDLLDLLYESGAEILCFRHTYEEAHGVLEACSRAFDKRQHPDVFGDVAHHFLERGATASDIVLEMARMQRRLPSLRIRVLEKPAYDREIQIDETVLEQTIEKYLPHHKDERKRRDVDSLSAVYRLRRGQEYLALEECPAIFITSNSALVAASNEFFANYQSPSSIRICMTDHHLTNVLWLKKPMSLPDLPRKQIIADCYAAMEPSDELWRKYLCEISKLETQGEITDQDYYLLRSALDAKTQLMDITQGSADAFVEGTVYEILDRVKTAIKADTVAELEEEKKKRQAFERSIEERDIKIDNASRTTGKLLSYSVAFIIVLLLFVGVFECSPFGADYPALGWFRTPVFFCSVFSLTVGFMNLLIGTTVRDLIRALDVRLSQVVKHFYAKLFG